ncbi:MAG: Hpt domain-containing protein [Planctomycetia bacterium]|nr:Hpt domain-containing protein [Planctomycetia bacterium]
MNLPNTPLYSALGSDPDFADLVDLYVDEMPERIVQLQALFAAEKWDELRRSAHQIKGAAGSYGFPQLTPIAGRLEHALSTAQPEAEIQANLEKLLALCAAVRAGAPDADFGAR